LAATEVPNKPLTGSEIAEAMCARLRKRLLNDWRFCSNVTYPRYAAELTVVFHLGTGVGDKEVRTFTESDASGCSGQPPLMLKEGEPSTVVAFTQSIEVENPNLERVQTGLPITETVRLPGRPDQVFQKIETRELPYDPSEYPPLESPPEADLSAQKVEEWGVALGGIPEGMDAVGLVAPPYGGISRGAQPETKLRKRKTPKGRQADVRS
jgi:hypothetical protein